MGLFKNYIVIIFTVINVQLNGRFMVTSVRKVVSHYQLRQ